MKILGVVVIVSLILCLTGCSDPLEEKCWASVRHIYSISGIRDPGNTIDRSDSSFQACVQTKGQGFF
jgi:hypothetical protein